MPKPLYISATKRLYGVFEHMDDSGKISGRGYVVRSRPDRDGYAYPYSLQTPVREYLRQGLAQALVERLTLGVQRYSPKSTT